MSDFDKDLERQLSKLSAEMKNDAHARSENSEASEVRRSQDLGSLDQSPTETQADYIKAIAEVYDLEERTLVPWMLLGDFAKAVKEKQETFMGPKIEVGFPHNSLTPEVKSLFKTWKFEETKKGYRYLYSPPTRWHIKIPVEITIWKRRYDFFMNPDFGFFGTEKFNIPNPFNKYWKARNLVQ